MSNLVIVRGLPGSGKTTFARAYMKDRVEGPAVLLAVDDYFIDSLGRYIFEPDRLRGAHTYCQERTFDVLAEGKTAIVHNTFTRKSEFEPYLRMLNRGGGKRMDSEEPRVNASVVVFNLYDAGLTDQELAARNAHGVRVNTIANMRSRYTPSPLPESQVHFAEGYAYWQYPQSGWVELDTTQSP